MPLSPHTHRWFLDWASLKCYLPPPVKRLHPRCHLGFLHLFISPFSNSLQALFKWWVLIESQNLQSYNNSILNSLLWKKLKHCQRHRFQQWDVNMKDFFCSLFKLVMMFVSFGSYMNVKWKEYRSETIVSPQNFCGRI